MSIMSIIIFAITRNVNTSIGLIVIGSSSSVIILVIVFFTTESATCIAIYEHGITQEHNERKITIMRWEEITSLFLSIQSTYILTDKHGRKMRLGLNLFSNSEPQKENTGQKITDITAEDIENALHIYSAPYRLRRALEQYDQGKTLRFGSLKISHAGIGTDRALLPWSKVADLDSYGNILLIRKIATDKPWKVMIIKQSANDDLLGEIIRQRHGEAFWLFQPQKTQPDPAFTDYEKNLQWLGRAYNIILGPIIIIGIIYGIGWGISAIRYPFSAPAANEQGAKLFAEGSFAEAQSAYATAIQRCACDPVYYVNHGIASYELDQLDTARPTTPLL